MPPRIGPHVPYTSSVGWDRMPPGGAASVYGGSTIIPPSTGGQQYLHPHQHAQHHHHQTASESGDDPRHRHHHHHHHKSGDDERSHGHHHAHHHHHHADDFDDAASDVSYYAKPKRNKTPGTAMSDSEAGGIAPSRSVFVKPKERQTPTLRHHSPSLTPDMLSPLSAFSHRSGRRSSLSSDSGHLSLSEDGRHASESGYHRTLSPLGLPGQSEFAPPDPRSQRAPSPRPITDRSTKHKHTHHASASPRNTPSRRRANSLVPPDRDMGAMSLHSAPRNRPPSLLVPPSGGLVDLGPGASPRTPAFHHAPSVTGMGPTEAYDDGASIAGSAMTFMDGSVGGRVSQYGLPKYSHQPKPDYRRCVASSKRDR